MSRLSKAVSKLVEQENGVKKQENQKVTNFMGGTNFKLNPLDTLKIISASSIFGEPSYYRNNKADSEYKITLKTDFDARGFELIVAKTNNRKSTTEIFIEAIDNALSYDFEGTLKLAVDLRKNYFMRLTPQIIAVRASVHKDRKKWSEANKGKFNEYQKLILSRADEVATQINYYLYMNKGKKNNMPSILKRSLANKLNSLDAYQVNKYKNAECGIINAVRITHASSPILNELLKTGDVKVEEGEETWEQKRSRGESWAKILYTCNLGHMALLRNIRNVFTEISDRDVCVAYMEELKNGVLKGKQFPFRYESAYREIEKCTNINNKQYILDSLEECVDIAVSNLPKLKGRTICLSDNSGSAWGAITSEYGTTKVANIDNLSAVITAACSDEGVVGKFGNTIRYFDISKRNGILNQTKNIDADGCGDVGGNTEGGIWEFFIDAIENNKWFDNIFIYSDMQAGGYGLYGTHDQIRAYRQMGYGSYNIDVYKLIETYRILVNPKVNVFSIQTAGYDNMILPTMTYRCALLSGWTGKESAFAARYIELWDEIDKRDETKKETQTNSFKSHKRYNNSNNKSSR